MPRVRRRVVVTAALAVLAASCGADHPSPAARRVIAIYSAVIRAALPPSSTNPSATIPTVFVTSEDTLAPITLDEQAGIVQTLHEVATIRFVDRRSEAIDRSDRGQPVHDNGVLLTLGSIPAGANRVTVEVQRYERIGSVATSAITLRRTGTTWTAESAG